jgi:hypothetical protein
MAIATGINTHVMVLKLLPIFSQDLLLWLCMAVSRMSTSVGLGFVCRFEIAIFTGKDAFRLQQESL